MRRLAVAAGWLAMFALPVWGAEEGGGHNLMLWRVVNFFILVGFLGYLIKKNAPPFFAGRSQQITQDLEEARKMTKQSEARAQAIEDRLSRLDEEIRELRAQAQAEMAAEHQRLERETERVRSKVSVQADQEMTAAVKAARLELRSYAASLAVELAEKRIAARITPPVQEALVGSFVRGLERPAR